MCERAGSASGLAIAHCTISTCGYVVDKYLILAIVLLTVVCIIETAPSTGGVLWR